jgi:hypothetical protein
MESGHPNAPKINLNVYRANIAKALSTQQFLKDLRGDAEHAVFFEPDRGDFRRRLRRERLAPGAKPRLGLA